MGLDLVDMFMEIEEAFDIRIEQADVDKVVTPGDLIDLVMSKVALADAAGCLTQRAFNRLRAALLRQLPLKRRDIAPSVRMAELVPRTDREPLLQRLAADLHTGPLPELERPQWLVRLIAGVSVALGLLAGLAVHKSAPSTPTFLTFCWGLGVAVLSATGASLATARLRAEFPALTETVGDLARWVMAHKTDLGSQVPGRWTREQVAARVREITIEQLGCGETYREDASLVKDLGAD